MCDKKGIIKDKIAAVVVSAGMSSRMKKFKPLLPIGHKTIIEHIVDSLKFSGVDEIILVTGHNTKRIVHKLKDRDIKFVYNEHYETCSMFDSVKLGMEYIKKNCHMFYFLPGDIPLFNVHSLVEMRKLMEEEKCNIVQPMYKEKHGHPVLFSAKCIDSILEHNGHMGLKGAIEKIPGKLDFALPDKGILLDADTPLDYKVLLDYYQVRQIPDEEMCFEILKYFKTNERIIKHSIAVLEAAKKIVKRLNRVGYELNSELIYSAALLHDIAKSKRNHPQVGGNWLRELGYERVAQVVETHMNIHIQSVEALDERAILYLADKLVIEDQEVSLEECFSKSFKKFGDNIVVLKALKNRYQMARRILDKISEKEKEIYPALTGTKILH